MAKNIDFIIIGFTGPIGSGCTTLAKIMYRVKPNGLIRKKHLYDNVCSDIKETSISMKNQEGVELEESNRRLIRSYQNRIILSEIQNFEDQNFTYISMSSVIMKIALKHISTPQFTQWKEKENTEEICELFSSFLKKWDTTMKWFDDYNDREFDEIADKDLINIDTMFSELNKLKDDIKGRELSMYFTNKLDEFPLQAFGDNIRKSGNPFDFSNDISSEMISNNVLEIPNEINRLIKFYRHRKDSKRSDCFIIDAFRNPIEIEFFRKRYAQFFLVSLYASYETRFHRLKKYYLDLETESFINLFKELDNRDFGGDDIRAPFKQSVSRCSYLSDIAINNDIDTAGFDDELLIKFLRYYALMISPGCIQPSKEETYMNLAYTLSLRSTCISRKVGAVITDRDGFLLGLGWNDVVHSQIGCGLRIKDDMKNYKERHSLDLLALFIDDNDINVTDNNNFCFKDIFSKKKIMEKLERSKLNEQEQKEVLEFLTIKRLEYCRSLHAEENALLQIAGKGGRGAENGTIYTTTFPCELCAKKIYQAGIKRIYYTEPYPKSISENFFLKDGIRKIEVIQFEGVKSFSFFKLFKPHLDRKEAQYLHESYYKLF